MTSPAIRSSNTYWRVTPALFWAMIGAGVLVFELYVVLRWIGSVNFHPVYIDTTGVSDTTRRVIDVSQLISPLVAGFIVLRFLVIPWWREGRLSTDGMLVIAYQSLWFQDPMGNFIRTQLYYSSAWVNMGSWTLGSFPRWISYNGNHLPEPILVMGLGYLWLGFSTALAANGAMQWARSRFPRIGRLELLLIALCIGILFDAVAEIALAAAGTFAWPAALPGFTLFYGQPYQFPMSEGVLFGATIVSGGVLRFYRDDQDRTIIDRGIDRLRVSRGATTALRFLAIFGFMQCFMMVAYSIPMALIGTHTTINQRYPSHLENNMYPVISSVMPVKSKS